MVDSRAKGRQAELKCRDELRKLTGLAWERTPMSGALDAKHMMKGDLYVPQVNTKYCVEVKSYKDDHMTTKLLTGVNPQLFQWWEQAEREANQMNKLPLLIFKHNRSKWFAGFTDVNVIVDMLDSDVRRVNIEPDGLVICLLNDFAKYAIFTV